MGRGRDETKRMRCGICDAGGAMKNNRASGASSTGQLTLLHEATAEFPIGRDSGTGIKKRPLAGLVKN